MVSAKYDWSNVLLEGEIQKTAYFCSSNTSAYLNCVGDTRIKLRGRETLEIMHTKISNTVSKCSNLSTILPIQFKNWIQGMCLNPFPS